MPSFGPTSQQRLATCHPDLQALFNAVIVEMDCTILCGHRNQADQNRAFAENNSRVQWPNGKHNSMPSMAVDAGPYFAEIGNVDWDDIKAFCIFGGRVIQTACYLRSIGQMSHGLRYGGDWDGDGRTLDQQFNDLVHFELIAP
ncbi:MAG: M15 family peptidase [Pseudomonadota bacterium]